MLLVPLAGSCVMLGGRGWLLAVVLVTAGMAGCLGGDDQTGQGDLQQTAVADADTGGIQGVVTDTAVQPVEGANVTLVETNQTVQTASDGSYAFSQVPPGTYTVAFRADAFVSTSKEVSVQVNEISTLDVLLSHLQSQSPFTQVFELQGFFECGVEVGWNVSQAPPPADYFFLGVAVCAYPNSIMEDLTGSGNATNDKFAHVFELEAPIDTMVYEMTWEASTQFSQWMTTRVEVEGFANSQNGTFFRTQGPSPIHVRLEKDVFEETSEVYQQACEEGNDDYCGYSFWDSGWPLQSRVFPAWQCASETGGGCVAAQQEFTHLITAFYNQEAPPGYSVVEGNS